MRKASVVLTLLLFSVGLVGCQASPNDSLVGSVGEASGVPAAGSKSRSPDATRSEVWSDGVIRPGKKKNSNTIEVNPMPDGGSAEDESRASNVDADARWGQFPWDPNPDPARVCPAPAQFPGATKDPKNPTTVVVIGDSLIRNAQSEIVTSLREYGFDPVLICYGGKTLEWGMEQIAHMRTLEVLPDCVVVNLGTNDLKGTTAERLADAVDPSTVESRLTALLSTLRDVPDVFAVNLAANLKEMSAAADPAADTMAQVRDTVRGYQNAVDSTGVGAIVDWAAAAEADPSLMSDYDFPHDSESGRAVRARLIAEAVARDCG